MTELKDKVVIITGGSLGIGKCMAMEFAKNNANIIICSRTKPDLDKSIAEIRKNSSCEGLVVDVSDKNQVKKLFDFVIDKYSKLDILVNCAAIYGPIGALETNNIDLWQDTININLMGTVYCIKQAIPIMKKQGHGKIINMVGAGIGWKNIAPNFSAYISSKAAISGLTEVMSRELKEFNIQINAISPGPVNTRLLDQVIQAGDAAGKEHVEKSIKQKREGGTPPEKAAKLALFLSSGESDIITGKTISAAWDDYLNFKNLKKTDSIYNLRRIDNRTFFEESDSAGEQNNYLDKQKVKEIINKHKIYFRYNSFHENLIKDLGLE